MMDAGRHPRIEILRCAELLSLEGEAGDFRARVRRHATGVDAQKCTACGTCREVCNFHAPAAFDAGIGERKAIDRVFPQSVPAAYAIDFNLCRKCKRCVKACPRGAIDLDAQPQDETLAVGAVVVATGFAEFDPSGMRNYGYGVYPNIVTSLQFERLLNASGPTRGHVQRPSDGRAPRRLAYVQCVGARGEAGRFYCSRFCCMNAVKDAILVKQHDPDVAGVTILYTDIRAFAKGSDDLVARARDLEWIRFLRGRPAKIDEDPASHDLTIQVEDTESGKQERIVADMVVLSCAGAAAAGTSELAERLGLPLDEMGFFSHITGESPVVTARPGVFLAGSAGGPQVIPDCVAQGSAAAVLASAACGADARAPESDDEKKPCDSDAADALATDRQAAPVDISTDRQPRVGVFLCHCGVNIAGVLDMPRLLASARKVSGVAHVSEELFACSSTSQEAIQHAIRDAGLDRVVVAACTPRTHEPIFRKNCEAAGLNPYLLEMVNIRDQCSWVHASEPEAATRKAADLVRMAVQRARRLAPLTRIRVGVTPRVLILGGGAAGMRAALDLRALNLDVVLVERGAKLGGLTGQLHSLYPDDRVAADAMGALAAKLEASGAEVHLNSEVREITGYVGNFHAHIGPTAEPSSAAAFERGFGVILIASGAEAYEPQADEYGFSHLKNVVTSLDLERRLADPDGLRDVRSAVFIQCVGSRRGAGAHGALPGQRGCSRICCPLTVKQTRALQRRGVASVVCYRDMRTVSHGAEEAYREARREGVLFLRFHEDQPPQVRGRDGVATEVAVRESLLRRDVIADADLVVLATGLQPHESQAKRIQEMLKTPRGSDGFFLERHPELGPVETCIDGVVVCGTAQGPKDLADTFAQASAAAAKAAAWLGRRALYLEPTISAVDPERCRACARCVNLCEFHAPELVTAEDGTRAAVINPALCKGCGTCAVWCPSGAIRAHHFRDDQVTAMIDSLFEAGAER